MEWNYRVAHRPGTPVPSYGIYEVYYDEDGDIVLYSKDPIMPHGDLMVELQHELEMMMKAFDKEMLNLNHVDHMIKTREQVKGKYKGLA